MLLPWPSEGSLDVTRAQLVFGGYRSGLHLDPTDLEPAVS